MQGKSFLLLSHVFCFPRETRRFLSRSSTTFRLQQFHVRWAEGVSLTKHISLPLLSSTLTQFPVSCFKDEDIFFHHIDISAAIWHDLGSTFYDIKTTLDREKKVSSRNEIDDLLAKDQTNFLMTQERNRLSPNEESSLTKFHSICKIKMRKIFVCSLRQSWRSFDKKER